jgi:hypothetical protein
MRAAVLIWLAVAWPAFARDAPEYVGSKVCFGCHAQIYRSYFVTDMGRSMAAASEVNDPKIPSEATVAAPTPGRVLRVYRDAAGWHQSETEPGVFVDEHKLEYVIGSGANGLTFLVTRGSDLFQAPLSFYSKPRKWDLSPGYESADIGFSRPIAEQCIACHSGRGWSTASHNEPAIGCESCHGPGERHAKTHGAIVNPAKLAPRLAEDICVYCHQRGDTRITQPGKRLADFRPGQPLIETVVILKVPPKADERDDSDLLEHDSAMKLSRCFRESGGKLSCLTCHDPHVQPSPKEAANYFRAKCLTCHTEASCRLPKPARLAHDPPDDCAGCHMPKRNIAVISHSALTNHRIPARPDEPVPAGPAADESGLIVVNRPDHWNKASPGSGALPGTLLLRAYSELAGKNPEYQTRYFALLDRLGKEQARDPFVQAALGHRALMESRPEEVLEHLNKALPTSDPIVYRDMAQALDALGRSTEGMEYLKKAVELQPYEPTTRKTLILAYIKGKRYPEARQAMEEYVSLFPEDAFMRGLLARVSK